MNKCKRVYLFEKKICTKKKYRGSKKNITVKNANKGGKNFKIVKRPCCFSRYYKYHQNCHRIKIKNLVTILMVFVVSIKRTRSLHYFQVFAPLVCIFSFNTYFYSPCTSFSFNKLQETFSIIENIFIRNFSIIR